MQRVRAAVPPPGEARADWAIVTELARRLGAPAEQWAYAHPAEIMAEIDALTPSYAGITYDRIERDGLCWPCPDTSHPGTPILHIGQLHPRQGQVLPDRLPGGGRGGRRGVPAHPDHGTHARALPHGHHDAALGRPQRTRAHGLRRDPPATTPRRLGIADSDGGHAWRRGAGPSASRPTSPTGCGPARCSCPSTSGSRRPTGSPTTARDPAAKIPEFKVCACRVKQ